MEKVVCYLVLDYDGVLVPAEEIYDVLVHDEICEEASNIYREELLTRKKELEKIQEELIDERSGAKSLNEIKKELDDIKNKMSYHYFKKDQVLEESLPEYVNRIPYDKIYIVENIFPGVLELIHKLYDMGIYTEIIVNTHVNVDSEIKAKRILLETAFPPTKFIPVQFYLERRLNNGMGIKRTRSNKVARLLKALPYIKSATSNSVFVDNTLSVLDQAEKFKFKCFFVRKNEDKIVIENPVINPIPYEIILEAGNYTIVEVQKQKEKKLIL